MRDRVDRPRNFVPVALAALFVGLHIALAWFSRNPGISWAEDDATYIILGREILHGSYAERWDILAPTHARYPPGFPALLSLGNAVFGDHVAVYTVLVLLCSAASIALAFLVVRRHFGDAVAVFVTGLLAINTMAVAEASLIMAEAPFRLWLTVVLWSASREHPSRGHLALAGASAVIAALTRSVGVAVIAALALHWIFERRWKAVALLAVGSVPVALWFVWTAVAPDPNQRGLYLHTVLTTAQSGESPGISMLRRVITSIVLYPRTMVPGALSFLGLKSNPADNVLWALLALVTIPIGAVVAWRRWRLMALVVLFYGLALIVWPWRYERFVSPVSALLLAIIGAGVMHLVRHRTPRTQFIVLAAVASPFVAGALQTGVPELKAMLACDRSRIAESPTCFPEEQRGLLQLAAFAREHTPDDAVFFVSKEAAFYWQSGRRTVRNDPFLNVPTDSFGALLRGAGVTYAVLSPVGANRGGHNRAIARACREFESVATFAGDAVLLKLREGGPIDHDDATCQLIAEWKQRTPPRWVQ